MPALPLSLRDGQGEVVGTGGAGARGDGSRRGLDRGRDGDRRAGGGAGREEGAAVRGVDGGGERAGERVDRGQVAVDHAARAAADLEQAAHLAARRPAAGRRAGPGRGLVGDDRVGGAGRAVDERDVRRAAVELLDGDLPVLRELIEQQVAAVHQVVRVIAVDHELADRRVQVGELASRSWRPRRRGPWRSGRTARSRPAAPRPSASARSGSSRPGPGPAARRPAWRHRRSGSWRGPTTPSRTSSAAR